MPADLAGILVLENHALSGGIRQQRRKLHTPTCSSLMQSRRIAGDFSEKPVELRIFRASASEHAYFNRL